MADVTFTISIKDDGTPVLREIKKEAQSMGDTVATAGKKASGGLSSVGSAATGLRGVFAGLSAFALAKEFISLADTAKNLEGRLKLVTSSSAELASVQQQLFTVAQQTRTSYESTVGLYASLSGATKELGLSQERLMRITTQLNQLTALSGASSEASANALFQLQQAFRGGTLRAEEFNSIIDQAPAILETMAKGMGVSMGEFRARVVDGGIAVDEMLSALEKMRAQTEEDFAKLPPTVGGALTQLSNSVLKFVGDLDKATGASETFARVVARMAAGVEESADRMARKLKEMKVDRLREVTQEINRLQLQLETGSGATFSDFFKAGGTDIVSLTARIKILTAEQSALRQALTHTGEAAVGAGSKIDDGLTPAIDDGLTPAQRKANEEARKLVDQLTKQTSTLGLTGKALADVVAAEVASTGATAEHVEAVRAAVLAQEARKAALAAGKKAEQENAAAIKAAKAIEEEGRKRAAQAIADEQKAFAAYQSQLQKSRDAIADNLTTLMDQTQEFQIQEREIRKGIATGEEWEQIQRNIASAVLEETAAVRGLTKEQLEANRALLAAKTGAQEAEQAYRQLGASALITTKDLDTLVTGVLQGTQKLPDALEALGVSAGIKLVKGILFGKGGTEQAILGNFEDLLNPNSFAGQIFQGAGAILGGDLVKSITSGIGVNSGILRAGWNVLLRGLGNFDLDRILAGGKGIFAGLGKFASGLLGHFAGDFFSGLFGLNKSQEGKIGGQVLSTISGIIGSIWGPAGAFVGAFLGDIFGSLFGGLFAHVPTRGTQIRRAAEQWLSEIGVTFADQVKSKNYFFEETKDLAESMFGGDFLQASKKILKDKAGPELAREFQALGAFVTADMARDLGKPVEQTATTFGNMIIAGIGDNKDKLASAIDEIVQKGQISLEGLVNKINETFEAGAISEDFYKDVIQGAVSIFSRDLPAAINVSKIALASFTDDGIFSLSTFQEKIEKATQLFQGVGQAAMDALLSPLSDAEALKQFDDALKNIERQLVSGKFLEDFQKTLFDKIDLSDGLGADEAELLRSRLAAGRKELRDLLEAAGLLPGALSESTAEASQFALTVAQAVSTVSRGALEAARQTRAALQQQLDEELARGYYGSVTLIRTLRAQLADGNLGAALGASLREQIATDLQAGIEEALIQAAINQAILEPFKKALAELVSVAMEDGVLSADELAAIGELGAKAAAASEEAAKAIGPALRDAEKLADGIKNNMSVGAAELHDIDLSSIVDQSKAVRDYFKEAADALTNASLSPKAPAPFAAGGLVGGSGSGDVIPALLDPREFVMNPQATQKHLALLAYLNSGGELRRFATGGPPDHTQLIQRLVGSGIDLSSLSGLVQAINKLTQMLAHPPNSTMGQLLPSLIADLTKKLRAQIESILDPIKSFIGESADPAARVREQFETLKKSLLDNRAELEKSGVDVDKYLALLASALPERIREAVEAANQATISALDSIKSTKERLLGGLGANPFEEEARRSAQIAQLQAQFAGASGDKKAQLGQQLTELLAQQVERSGFDKFGLDFAGLRTRNLGLIEEIEKALQKQLDEEMKKALTPPPAPPPSPPPPPPPPRGDARESGGTLQLNLTIPITPGVDINGKALWQQIMREAERQVEEAVDRYINQGKARQSILKLLKLVEPK